MRWVRINVHDKRTNIIRKEQNEKDVFMINNVFLEWKTKWWETNVDLSHDSQAVWLIDRESGKKEPVRMVRRFN